MSSLLDQISAHARRRPDAVAYREIGADLTLTYSQLIAGAQDLSRKLIGGSTIILRLRNTCEYPIAFLGGLMAGCAVFPVPADLSEPEFRRAVDESGAASVITAGLVMSPTYPQSSRKVEPGLLLQSSGTTGLPKIVHRSAASLDAVSSNMVAAIGFGADDRVLATVPLCHSYGLEHGLLAPLYAGATVHLAHGFDLHLVLGQLTGQAITTFPAVPSMFEMLAQLADDGTRFPTLRTVYSAGGPLPQGVADAFCRKYGVRISQLYGATEIGSVTFTPASDPHFDPRSVGRAMAGVEIRIAGQSEPQVGEGEVQVRATSMFSGYLNGDSTLTPDGFFPTGDLGRLDDHGNLTITGRIKLLIDVGGLKVNPLEVEAVLCQHPGVATCVVVPMPLSQTISRIKAVIRPADPSHPPAAEELRQFARARLTPHKIPRVFEFRDSLPTSATGKILRHLVEA